MGLLDKIGIKLKSNDDKQKVKSSQKDSMKKNFSYLEDLIRSGSKNIVLNEDIVLESAVGVSAEKLRFEFGIPLDVDGLVIDGNNHYIDARNKTSIFRIKAKNIIIKNLTLKNAYSKSNSAVNTEGEVSCSFENCNFEDNLSKSGAGAIYNVDGDLKIFNSHFVNNRTDDNSTIVNFGKIEMNNVVFENNNANDGSILHNVLGADLTISNSKFINNSSNGKGALVNESNNDIKIVKCTFSNHPNDVISNKGFLEIIDSTFNDNTPTDVIKNENNSILYIRGGKFFKNSNAVTTIHNLGTECSISKTIFENNVSKRKVGADILNENKLSLQNPNFKSGYRTVINKGNMELRKMSSSVVKKTIHNFGTIEEFDYSSDNKSDFAHLDDLIREISKKASDKRVLHLDQDISIENNELDFYEGGIDLTVDNLVVDGHGKTIDGNNKSRIFNVLANNVTFKNVIFKNGTFNNRYRNQVHGGGAIYIGKGHSLKLDNCHFIDNHSNNYGGAIVNNGILESIDSLFNNNKSNYGGAILNKSVLKIIETKFNGNVSKLGAAIYNDGELELDGSTSFLDNSSDVSQAVYNANAVKTDAIHNVEEIIFNTNMINHEKADIQNFTYFNDLIRVNDEITLDKDIFFDYSQDSLFKDGISINKNLIINGNDHSFDGRGISALFTIHSKVIFKDVVFKNCNSISNSIIENLGEIIFENCKFINNNARGDNVIINNQKSLKLVNSNFFNNSSKKKSIIVNDGELEILNAHVMNNYSDSKGTFIYNANILNITGSLFRCNISDKNGGVLYNNSNADLNMSETRFLKNESYINGGVLLNFGKSKITESIFEDNISNQAGGAIHNYKKMKIYNSSFINNSAVRIGGAVCNNGRLILKNDIFKGNSASSGGGIWTKIQHNIIGSITCKFEDNTPDGVY